MLFYINWLLYVLELIQSTFDEIYDPIGKKFKNYLILSIVVVFLKGQKYPQSSLIVYMTK